MIGLLQKIWVEVRWPVLFFSLGLFSVMSVLTALLPKILANMNQFFDKMPMIRPLLTALLGVDPGNQASAQISQAFLWVHPTVLSLIWAHEVMYCSRVPAGEVDRGTADFLLCLPLSRWEIFWAETVGWLVSGTCIILSGYAGHLLISLTIQPDMRLSVLKSMTVIVNLSAVYLAIGSFSFFVSTMSNRRGRAIGIVFTVLLASFLLNFLAQFQDWAKFISPWLSVMAYYRPAIIIQSGEFPWFDIAVLVFISGLIWLASGFVFHYRSICTV